MTSVFLPGMKGHQHLPHGVVTRTERDNGYEIPGTEHVLDKYNTTFLPFPASPASLRLKA